MNHNLFATLRAAFPRDLDGIAVETDAGLQQALVTEPPFFDAEKRIARGLPLQA